MLAFPAPFLQPFIQSSPMSIPIGFILVPAMAAMPPMTTMHKDMHKRAGQ